MAIKGLVYFFYSPFQGMIYWLYRLLSAGKGADMNYYNASGQMDLSDRIAIETGICIGESFKKIAKRLRRHPSTIAHEVKENRTFIKGNYPNGKDCSKVRHCTVKNLCGCDEEACNTKCKLCRGVDCTKVCDRYVSVACHKFDSPPYVCNNCKDKKLCNKDKYIYSAKFADAAVTRRRSESRQGVRLADEKKEELDELVTRLVKKGQPLTHIYAEHENEMPVCLRTLYNYIDEGALPIKNIDLRRKTGYKPRKKKYNDINGFHSMEYRQCRTYEDFEYAMKFKYSEDEVTEMDTVKGVRESGKRLLTMIFRKNNVMLLFLMPDGKAESVKRVLDYLETGLGIDVFRRLFPVILTDNGSEFKKVDELELTLDEDGFLVYRTSLYYCDPMASWQKGCIEKNHEFIRYAVPKGKSLNPYTQEDMTLLMNHINSVKRPGLGNKSPYELVEEDDEDFKALMSLLKMHLIPPDEVHLMPDLFVKK